MSSENRTGGSTNIYNIPPSAYQEYAKTEQKLAETRKLIGEQGAAAARRGAQLIDTTIKPSELDLLWGSKEKASPVKIDEPPGYGVQIAPLNTSPEFVFGSVSHINSLDATIDVSNKDPREISAIKALLKTVTDDLTAKNGVLARRGSLQQG